MKRKLVSILCCALIVSNFAACGKEPANNEVSQEPSQVTASSDMAETSSESQASSEVVESVESSEIATETATESTAEEVLYSVELTAIGDDKVAVIQTYRNLTGLGLKEAKDIVDTAPCILFENTSLEEAEIYKTSFEECGATITILEGNAQNASSEATEETEASTSAETTESSESADSSASETTGGTFTVDKVFNITGTGTVITGKVEQGTIKLGDSAVIILEDGTEIPVTINRIEVFGGLLEVAEEGKVVSLGFEESIEKDAVLTAVSIVVKAE